MMILFAVVQNKVFVDNISDIFAILMRKNCIVSLVVNEFSRVCVKMSSFLSYGKNLALMCDVSTEHNLKGYLFVDARDFCYTAE